MMKRCIIKEITKYFKNILKILKKIFKKVRENVKENVIYIRIHENEDEHFHIRS
jgi:uncharacterized protein YqgV (UPF0045/DUF77 family)